MMFQNDDLFGGFPTTGISNLPKIDPQKTKADELIDEIYTIACNQIVPDIINLIDEYKGIK